MFTLSTGNNCILYNKRIVIRVLHWKSISDLISARGLRTDTQSWRYQPYKLHHIIIKYMIISINHPLLSQMKTVFSSLLCKWSVFSSFHYINFSVKTDWIPRLYFQDLWIVNLNPQKPWTEFYFRIQIMHHLFLYLPILHLYINSRRSRLVIFLLLVYV